MTNLKQCHISWGLINIVSIAYLINDGHHNKELCDLINVENTLFNELNGGSKIAFKIWLSKNVYKNMKIKPCNISWAVIYLINIAYMMNDGYHNKELRYLINVENTLFNELNRSEQFFIRTLLNKKAHTNEKMGKVIKLLIK